MFRKHSLPIASSKWDKYHKWQKVTNVCDPWRELYCHITDSSNYHPKLFQERTGLRLNTAVWTKNPTQFDLAKCVVLRDHRYSIVMFEDYSSWDDLINSLDDAVLVARKSWPIHLSDKVINISSGAHTPFFTD